MWILTDLRRFKCLLTKNQTNKYRNRICFKIVSSLPKIDAWTFAQDFFLPPEVGNKQKNKRTWLIVDQIGPRGQFGKNDESISELPKKMPSLFEVLPKPVWPPLPQEFWNFWDTFYNVKTFGTFGAFLCVLINPIFCQKFLKTFGFSQSPLLATKK